VLDIARKHVRLQTESGVVGSADRVVLIDIRNDARHWPKDFLACDPHLIGNAGEDLDATRSAMD